MDKLTVNCEEREQKKGETKTGGNFWFSEIS
ncbi:hypothetical protein cce_2807 [Crocosphaera subtropica ATCC 51142]|uniref:Uncharacterized protein n=1 Tax=Crocosphaera subtropica (strain ATCC 51142 / BH68) TaxID=43989 RepID=B1WU93_CROS5|nr:hypothetical protein cce_2807 [Crocosphaera subtropica ATCC 51142]